MPAPSSVNPGPDIEVEPASSDVTHVDVSLGSEGYVSDPSETQSQAAHPSASSAVILYSEARAELPRAEIPRSQLEEVCSASASSRSRRGKVVKQRLDFDVKLEDYKHRYQSADHDSLVRELVVKDTQIESLAEGARKDNQKMEALNRKLRLCQQQLRRFVKGAGHAKKAGSKAKQQQKTEVQFLPNMLIPRSLSFRSISSSQRRCKSKEPAGMKWEGTSQSRAQLHWLCDATYQTFLARIWGSLFWMIQADGRCHVLKCVQAPA